MSPASRSGAPAGEATGPGDATAGDGPSRGRSRSRARAESSLPAGTTRRRLALGLAVLLVLAGAAWIDVAAGRRGFFAFDQSILFDAGFRILSGQTPFADFRLPFGPIAPALQAVLFRLFGVDFAGYLASAALANAVATALAMALLARLLPGRPAWWLLGGALTAIWFYPPFGTPWIEQTALLFVLAGIVLLLPAVLAERPRIPHLAAAAGSGACAVLALLTKQNAGGAALPAFALLLAVPWLALRREHPGSRKGRPGPDGPRGPGQARGEAIPLAGRSTPPPSAHGAHRASRSIWRNPGAPPWAPALAWLTGAAAASGAFLLWLVRAADPALFVRRRATVGSRPRLAHRRRGGRRRLPPLARPRRRSGALHPLRPRDPGRRGRPAPRRRPGAPAHRLVPGLRPARCAAGDHPGHARRRRSGWPRARPPTSRDRRRRGLRSGAAAPGRRRHRLRPLPHPAPAHRQLVQPARRVHGPDRPVAPPGRRRPARRVRQTRRGRPGRGTRRSGAALGAAAEGRKVLGTVRRARRAIPARAATITGPADRRPRPHRRGRPPPRRPRPRDRLDPQRPGRLPAGHPLRPPGRVRRPPRPPVGPAHLRRAGGAGGRLGRRGRAEPTPHGGPRSSLSRRPGTPPRPAPSARRRPLRLPGLDHPLRPHRPARPRTPGLVPPRPHLHRRRRPEARPPDPP